MTTHTISPNAPTLTAAAPAADKFASIEQSIPWNLFLIFAGSVICSWAINGILVPHGFLSGGLTGVALIIHYGLPGLPLGLLYLLLNVPVYILGWVHVGRRFFWYSVAGMLIFSCTVNWVGGTCPVEDKLLAALLAGIISGAGAGLILRSLGTAGGTDIISIILQKKYSIRIGSSVLFFNACVLAASALLFSLEAVLYTMICMFVASRVVEMVLTGLSQRKAVTIVTPHWQSISAFIRDDLNRGVTEIPSRGGYSGEQGYILYTVVTLRELARLKEYVSGVDPTPFVVVSNTLEVMGKRIGNQPRW